MAVEIKVVDEFVPSSDAGMLIGTVVVRFDKSDMALQIDVVFPDRNDRDKNKAEAISAARELASRFANFRGGLLE